jgi:hypothetical protein
MKSLRSVSPARWGHASCSSPLRPRNALVAYAAVRSAIAALVKWLLVPSLALVLVSGLLAIALNRAYRDAGWAWPRGRASGAERSPRD